jgi:hypothetical protein
MPVLSRRQALSTLGAWAFLVGSGCRPSSSRTPPRGGCGLAGRRIRWIVPNAPGGGYDAESRLLEPILEQWLGAEIAVDNVAGAGGILGARAIAAAAPDGLTLGVVGVPGLLVAALSGTPGAPSPVSDFTVLGRVSRSYHVWAAGAAAGLPTLEAVMAAAEQRRLVFGINEVGSASFVSITGAASMLGVEVELVAGLGGTRGASLAAMRGDVDLVCFNFDTIVDLIESGDLRPLLQVSHGQIAPHPLLEGVGVLGGDDGLAMRRAREQGRDVDQAQRHVAALVDVIGAGRVVVGPPGLGAELAACLRGTVHAALTALGQQAATRRVIDPADAHAAEADIRRAAAEAVLLVPDLEAAIRRVRRQ